MISHSGGVNLNHLDILTLIDFAVVFLFCSRPMEEDAPVSYWNFRLSFILFLQLITIWFLLFIKTLIIGSYRDGLL